MYLTQEQVDSLPDGTLVMVVWWSDASLSPGVFMVRQKCGHPHPSAWIHGRRYGWLDDVGAHPLTQVSLLY